MVGAGLFVGFFAFHRPAVSSTFMVIRFLSSDLISTKSSVSVKFQKFGICQNAIKNYLIKQPTNDAIVISCIDTLNGRVETGLFQGVKKELVIIENQ